MKFFDVVDNLLDTYGSIDVRVVAFIHNSVWKAAFLILRFRREGMEEVKKEHNELLKKIGKIDEDDFCVRLYALPISNWKSIKENWQNNFVCIEPNFAVNFDRHDDMNVEVAPYNYYYEYVNTDWNCYYTNARSLHDTNIQPKIKQYDKKAQLLNFKDITSYLSVALSINEQQLQTQEGLRLILTPLYFKILEYNFDNDSISLSGRGYSNKKMKIVVDFYNNRSGSDPYIWKDRIEIAYTIQGSSQIANFSINHPVPKISISDGFKITAYNEHGLMLQEISTSNVGYYWNTKSSITNPIYPVFKEFVNFDDLKKMLLQSETKNGKKDSANFEKGVSWLMNILGLNTIWLGKDFESTGSNEERIVIDLLGHNNSNHIFLVNVTTGIPTSSDFARERRYRENLQNKINNPNLIVSSILFSNGPVTNLIEAAKLEGLILIGKDEIEFLLKLIEKGDKEVAREYLARENIIF